MRYADHIPTTYDSHIPLEGREEWIVVPCIRTRDSSVWEESNFHAALELLGGESDTVETHRFGHWGPGWYEIIIVDPSRAKEVEAIRERLNNYPVLDEMDLSEREIEAEGEAWAAYGARDIRRALQDEFGLSDATAEWFNDDRLFCLYGDYTSGTEHSNEGPHFPVSWIKGASLTRDVLAKWICTYRARERALGQTRAT